jgi:hypothetical protein
VKASRSATTAAANKGYTAGWNDAQQNSVNRRSAATDPLELLKVVNGKKGANAA